jgi:hypothetical protein
MSDNGGAEGVRYPRGIRVLLLISLLIHIVAVIYRLGRRLSGIHPYRIYEGLYGRPQPGFMLSMEAIFAYGLFTVFLIWIAVTMYQGDDALAGKLCSICAFISALVVGARYLGRQQAGYSSSAISNMLMAIWFILWGVISAIYSFRATRFWQSRESAAIEKMIHHDSE